MNKTILLIGSFDTKGEEFAFVRDLIEARGVHTLLLDTSVLNEPMLTPDIPAGQVARAGGSSLSQLRKVADRGKAVDVMIRGVQKLVPELYEEVKFDGVLSLGGGAGTNIATAAMRSLPTGVPKLMVSTQASSDISTFVGVKDVTMMYSVVDIAGLNSLSRKILGNAAGAICGMVDQHIPAVEEKPVVAATMFGVTTPCVTVARRKLEEAGFEVLVFHATGSGGRAMESLIRDGYVDAVADLTTTEWCDEVVGGVLSAGPDRLEAAAETGIPQLVSCGALDMVNFHAMDTVPKKFKTRNLYKHNPTVTLMRTSADECAKIGERIAEKLNKSTGPVLLMLPLKGVSSLDQKGKPFFDPKANKSLFDSLRKHIDSSVRLVELDLHINDKAFAEKAGKELIEMLKNKAKQE
ncbi:MAG: Tm-1-like ATP-binding domain-containing protein [Balneolaceae bacterium]